MLCRKLGGGGLAAPEAPAEMRVPFRDHIGLTDLSRALLTFGLPGLTDLSRALLTVGLLLRATALSTAADGSAASGAEDRQQVTWLRFPDSWTTALATKTGLKV